MGTDNRIHVAFGADAAFAPHLATTLASIVANAPGATFKFLIVHDGMPAADQARIAKAARGQEIDWREITDDTFLAFEGWNHITRAGLYRLAIPELTDSDRIIYLDCDLVVLGDLRDLWATDLGGKAIGAVHDPGAPAEAYAARWGLPYRPLGYFNSGVLLIDLAKVRDMSAFRQALTYLATERGDFLRGDQDALNRVFWNAWTALDPNWNVQRRMVVHLNAGPTFDTPEPLRAKGRPKIVHYTEQYKPWHAQAWHPLTGLYLRYLRKTPYWKDVIEAAGASPLKRLRHFLRTQWTLARLAQS